MPSPAANSLEFRISRRRQFVSVSVSVWLSIHLYICLTPRDAAHSPKLTLHDHSVRLEYSFWLSYAMLAHRQCNDATEHNIISLLLYHGPQKWTPTNHFNHCGQSCGCCRSQKLQMFGACEICEQGVTIACLSRSALSLTRAYGMRHHQLSMHCSCGSCKNEWLTKGWICPRLMYMLEDDDFTQ